MWHLIFVFCFLSSICIYQTTYSLSIISSSTRRYFATTVRGLEDVLLREVEAIPGVMTVKQSNCGVEFSGDDSVGFRALLWLRTSLKLMELIHSSKKIEDRNHLHSMCSSIDWNEYLNPSYTIKCDSVLSKVSQDLSHSHFTSLTVKNAIVDFFREQLGSRPSVDTNDPDTVFHLYMNRDQASLYRLWSGTFSMHKRGYRQATIHKAALRETTAAALYVYYLMSFIKLFFDVMLNRVLLSKWDHSRETLCDPMCGSGTIPIEAALIAANTAPGLLRYDTEYDQEDPKPLLWKGVSKECWRSALLEARELDRRKQIQDEKVPSFIMANDKYASAVKLALDSSISAGVRHMIHFTCDEVTSFQPKTNIDIVISNPPWNIRLEGADEAWQALRLFSLGNVPVNKLWTLVGDPQLLKHMKRKSKTEIEFQASNTNLILAQF